MNFNIQYPPIKPPVSCESRWNWNLCIKLSKLKTFCKEGFLILTCTVLQLDIGYGCNRNKSTKTSKQLLQDLLISEIIFVLLNEFQYPISNIKNSSILWKPMSHQYREN